MELAAILKADLPRVQYSLGLCYLKLGRNKEALDEARLAVKQAPDEGNRKSLEGMIKQLEEGKTIN